MTYNGKLLIEKRTFIKDCRICGRKFESTQKNACYCCNSCRMEGRAIIARWRQKKKKWDEFKKLIEGGNA